MFDTFDWDKLKIDSIHASKSEHVSKSTNIQSGDKSSKCTFIELVFSLQYIKNLMDQKCALSLSFLSLTLALSSIMTPEIKVILESTVNR